MPKAFSVASWNVEHFKDDLSRVDRVVDFLKAQKADIVTLFEVEGKHVYSSLVERMPDYQFHITEGRQVQEILVGVKKTITSFFTQKTEFKSGVPTLRPGALLTVRVDGVDYSLLFLHTKSMNSPLGLGIRDDMFERALDFRKVLDKAAGGPANYMFLGDLNTMGMKYPFQKSIDADTELKKLDKESAKFKMRRLTKAGPTWWNGGGSLPPSNLDQAIAAQHLQFKPIGGFDMAIRGWPEESTDAAKKKWIKDFSDHALLYFEVQKV